MIYFLLILWILYCGIFYNYPKFRSISIWLIVVTLTLVMGLQGSDVGVDTTHYEQLFNSISHQSFFILFKDFYYESLEPGWVFLNKLVSTFGGNYFIFQFIVSSIICGLYGYVLIKESRNSYISVIVFLPK